MSASELWTLGPPLGWAMALLATTGVGVALGLRVARWRVVRRVARSRRLGRLGELRGRGLLEARGYRVIEEQVPGAVVLWVDGERREFSLRADAIVLRRRRRYVAEYKGGAEVARIEHRGTRRQLLEYAHAFDVAGVVLVDAHRGTIEHVEW